MDVHHHPDMHHKGKKFKEYFLEFLMIFLAVSLGFIAENLREHMTNSSKEKEYVTSFIKNLETDTANMRQVIEFDRNQINGIDSFMLLAHAPMTVSENRKRFYYLFMRYLFSSEDFTSDDATLQQLKSTGDFRLIERDHAADSIARYDADVHDIYAQGDYYRAYFNEILSRLDELTDMTVFDDTSYIQGAKFTSKPLPPLNDTAKLRVLFNKVFDFRGITGSYAEHMLKPELASATRLIVFLKKEYGIEE